MADGSDSAQQDPLAPSRRGPALRAGGARSGAMGRLGVTRPKPV
jgi:hypothetical protein